MLESYPSQTSNPRADYDICYQFFSLSLEERLHTTTDDTINFMSVEHEVIQLATVDSWSIIMATDCAADVIVDMIATMR